ncbi:MAG: BT_3928 family protein [Bacteroidota bacterium]
MKILQEFSRYAVGALFIFSGIIKVNDPVGTEIKLTEYFQVFATDIAPFFEWFVPASLFLSVFLSVLEVILGIALLIGYRMRFTAWTLLSMIVFFTFLTFYSAYFDKVTDCGCFGDAIKLTPWQSFKKDLILLVFIGIIFWKRKSFTSLMSPKAREIIILGFSALLVFVSIYAINHLPFVDFRAYKIGNNIPALMQNSEPLRYRYIMEKDGKEYEFDTYPTDEEYKYLGTELLNPEAAAKITDFNVWQGDNDFTSSILQGTKLLIVIHQVEKASLEKIDRLRNLTYNYPEFETAILTSSGYETFEAFRHQHQLGAPYYFADATVLKTMIRSNPGVILLENGTVVAKWHFKDTPLADEVGNLLASK